MNYAMNYPNSRAIHKKIFTIAMTSIISALIQSSYAEIATEQSDNAFKMNTHIQKSPQIESETADKYRINGKFTQQHWPQENTSPINHILATGSVWIQYFHSKATQDNNVSGYDATINGLSIGADNPLEEDHTIESGIAYTYAKGTVQGKDDSRNQMDTENHLFSLYTSYLEEDFFFDGRMSYSFGKNKGDRYVGGNQQYAKYNTRSWGVGLIAGHRYPLGHEWSWQPQIAFDDYTIKTDDHTKSARDPAQILLFHDQVNNGKYKIVELGAGLKLIGDIKTDTLVMKPELGLMGFHDFKKDPVTITAHFAAGGEHFMIDGANRNSNRYQLNAIINLAIHHNTLISFSYSHHWSDNFTSDGLITRVRCQF